MEMVTFLPIRGSLHRFVGAFVDPALGAASSVNYWILTVTMACLEINAFTSVLLYWVDERHLPMLNVMIPCLVLFAYLVLNIWDAGWFGEAEFWISIIKVVTALGLLVMTVFLMCGVNPQHDVFGFRYWVNPAPMNEYLFSGSKGRFCSVLAAIVNAAWTFQGPDMVSVIAGDTKNPRKVIPKAFRSVYVRLTVFFIGSAIAVGILVPYDDQTLVNAINNEEPGAARTAWVRALNRLDVPVLPHIINAVILTSIFSAGNALVFAGSRSLQAMAIEGKIFKIFARVNRNGTPYVAVLATLSIGLLSFLQVSAGASQVLFYFIDVSTSSLLVTWVLVSLAHLCWRNGIRCQRFPLEKLPYVSRWAPYTTYYALVNSTFVLLICGWNLFVHGQWDTVSFILQYFAIGTTIAAYLLYKVMGRTKIVRPTELEIHHGMEELVAHERELQREAETEAGAPSRWRTWVDKLGSWRYLRMWSR